MSETANVLIKQLNSLIKNLASLLKTYHHYSNLSCKQVSVNVNDLIKYNSETNMTRM